MSLIFFFFLFEPHLNANTALGLCFELLFRCLLEGLFGAVACLRGC